MSARTIYEHPLVRVETFPVRTRAGEVEYVRFRMQDWVNVVPVTRSAEVVLVRQHRWGIDAPSLEIPGGLVEPGEEPAAAARRELLEETGYGGGEIRSLGFVHPNPALQDNRTWLFLATGVERRGEPSEDPGEAIEVELHALDRIEAMIAEGRITHALAIVSLQRVILSRDQPRR